MSGWFQKAKSKIEGHLPPWFFSFKREIIAGACLLLVGIVALVVSLSAPDGLQISDSSASFSAQEVQGWMNQEILANVNTKDSKGKDPDELCPQTASGSSTCHEARINLQRIALRKLLPQAWALAQVQKEQLKLNSSMVLVSQKEMLKEIMAQTGLSNPQDALNKVGLTQQDLYHRAEAVAAFQKLLPPSPPPPSRKALRLVYKDVAPQLKTAPKGNVVVWQTRNKTKADAILAQLNAGGRPKEKPHLDLRGFDYKQAREMPPPWGSFIMHQPGAFISACAGNQWCVGLAGQPTPGKPAPPFDKVSDQLSSKMMYDLRNMQIKNLRLQLARHWENQTHCSGLPVCS